MTNSAVLPELPGSPTGDLLLCDVAREVTAGLLEDLRGLGLHRSGALEVSATDSSLSESP